MLNKIVTKQREKGITLVALVVTIVVLLILSGVTISLLLSDNGLIGRAMSAEEQMVVAKEKEAILMAYNSLVIDSNATTKEMNSENLQAILISDGYDVTVENDVNNKMLITFKESNRKYDLDVENGTIEGPLSSRVERVEISSGSEYIEYTGNEIVFIPTKFDSNKMEITGNRGTEIGEYVAIVSLKDKSDMWENGSKDPISINWQIVSERIMVSKPSGWKVTGLGYYYTLESTIPITYDGNAHRPDGIQNGDLTKYRIEGEEHTDTGTYEGRITLIDPVHYKWNTGTSEDIKLSWKINIVNVSKPSGWKVTGLGYYYTLGSTIPITYDGNEHSPDGIQNGDLTKYRIEGEAHSEIGTYEGKITLIDPIHYHWSDGGTDDIILKWKINGVEVSKPSGWKVTGLGYYYTLESTIPITYDGNEHRPDGIQNGDLTKYRIEGEAHSEIGTYEGRITLIDPIHYHWSDGSSEDIILKWRIQ